MGWSEYYESSFSQVLHNCLVRLCSENLPVEGKVEIDGIVCINVASSEKQIVLKVHDIVDKSKSSSSGSRNGGKPSAGHEGLGKSEKGSLSLLQPKMKQSDFGGLSQPRFGGTSGQDSDDAIVELYKKEMLQVPSGGARLKSNHPVSETSLSSKTSPPAQQQAQSGGSRRKQAKPQMVTHVPDDDEEDAMSTGDAAEEAWYSDSDADGDHASLSTAASSSSLSLFPYNVQQRPPRQRVPLREEIQTGVVFPSDFSCRKCVRKFYDFAQLQVHNMEVHKRYTRAFHLFSCVCI